MVFLRLVSLNAPLFFCNFQSRGQCGFVDTRTDYLQMCPLPEQRVVVVHYLSFVQLLGGRDLSDTVQQRCQRRLLPVRITSSAAAISNHLIKMEIDFIYGLSLFCVILKQFYIFFKFAIL